LLTQQKNLVQGQIPAYLCNVKFTIKKTTTMQLTLTTYDSIVNHKANSMFSANTTQFANMLTVLTKQFKEAVGAHESQIYWEFVTDSDWCAQYLFIYARVPKDWKPTPLTFIIDEYDNFQTAKTFGDYVYGRGRCRNVKNEPPTNPHNLFRSTTHPDLPKSQIH
jgi:hypothetical protein